MRNIPELKLFPGPEPKHKSDAIAIIGAGVIGVTQGIELQEKEGFTNVTILAKTLNGSRVAPGSFKPTLALNTPDLKRIIQDSWNVWMKIASQRSDLVWKMTHMEADDKKIDMESKKAYIDVVEYPQLYENMPGNIPGEYQNMLSYQTFLMHTGLLMDFLLNRFQGNGGRLLIGDDYDFKTMEDIEQLPQDIIFDCTGIAKEPFGIEVTPIKGQTLVVKHDIDFSRTRSRRQLLPHETIAGSDLYGNKAQVYNRRTDIIIGATMEVGVWDTEFNAEKTILSNVRRIVQLRSSDILDRRAGHRPVLDSGILVCCERRERKRIIHSRGQGGAGWTTAWGSAIKGGQQL